MSGKMYNRICTLVLLMMTVAGILTFGKNADAAASFKIKINKQQNVVTIYKTDENNKYVPYKAMLCSVGAGTPLGNYSLKEKIRWHELDGPVYGQYCSRITGHILFHSVWYYKMDPATLSYAQYNKLGSVASHGCVRLNVRDAKWIYNYISSGTPIEIYNSSDPGPLGKPEALKVSGYTGWDPTDEANPNNPYNKRKPVITLKRGVGKTNNILFGSDINILSNVTAKNTTGFDITGKIKYSAQYKEKYEKTYRKVKKFSTRRAGVYLITYKVTDQMGRKDLLKVKYNVMNKVPMEKFTLNKTLGTLYIGGRKSEESVKLKQKTVSPENTSIKKLVYKSLNENVAVVDEKGKVTAIAPGITKIMAKSTDGTGIKVYCKIYVRKYAEGILLNAAKSELVIGETTTVTMGVYPEDATGGKDASYEYLSSDPNIATVDEKGNVTAIGAGTVTITVIGKKYTHDKSDISAQTVITVTPSGTDVTPSALTINQ